MTDHPGRRRHNPSDPTDEPTSDPVPTGEDIVNRDKRGHATPRRYDEALKDEPEKDEASLNTQM